MKITVRFELPQERVDATLARVRAASADELAELRKSFREEMIEGAGVDPTSEEFRAQFGDPFGIDPAIGLPFTKSHGEMSHEEEDVPGEDEILMIDEAFERMEPPLRASVGKLIAMLLCSPDIAMPFLESVQRAALSMTKERGRQ